jgi:hypothetical protein
MLLTDLTLTHPFTVVALVIEAGLVGLGLLAGAFDVIVRPVRWLARGLAAVGIALGLLGAADMLSEVRSYDFPLVRPDAPLGTYVQPTTLGLLLGATQFGLLALVAALAFRRPRLSGLLLVGWGVLALADSARVGLQDPTFPPANILFAVIAVGLPAVAVGTLLLGIGQAQRGSAALDHGNAGGNAAVPRSAKEASDGITGSPTTCA